MSGPVGAGAGPPPAPAKLRDATYEESKEIRRLSDSTRGVDPVAMLRWLKAHPDVRSDSPVIAGRFLMEIRQWQYDYTIAALILTDPEIPVTHPVVEEVLRRIPDFDRKDLSGFTLPNVLEIKANYFKVNAETTKRPRDIASANIVKAKYDLFRERMKERFLKPIGEVRMAESLARQKNLPPDVGDLIASKLSGQTGSTSSQIQTQRETAKKQLTISGGRRRKRKTRRTRRR